MPTTSPAMPKKPSPDERGSALLLTLGILSLALIVGLAFAFSARLNRKIAKINADQSKARLLAESALNLAIATLMYNDDVYPPTVGNWFTRENGWPGFLVSKRDNLEGDSTDQDNLYDLENDAYILPVLKCFGNSLPEPEYLNVTIEVDEEEEEIIGRVAFLALEEGDKLDLNQILRLSGNNPFVKDGEDRLASFLDNATADDYIYAIDDGIRLGRQMQELRVNPAYLSSLPDGYPGTKARWFSYSHLGRKLWENNSPAPDDPPPDDPPPDDPPPDDPLRYTFFSGEDIEAWWDPGDKKEYHRFDLSGYEWRSVDPLPNYYDDDDKEYKVISANTGWSLEGGEELVTKLCANILVEFADDTYTCHIPYLSQMVDAGGDSVSKQVAANLIDFCDADHFATTDATWEGKPPTYCGNEKVPYINKIRLSFTLSKKTDNGTHTYRLKLTPSLELVNIYNEEKISGEVRFRVYFTVTVQSGGEEKEWSDFVDVVIAGSIDPLSYATIPDTAFTGKEIEVTASVSVTLAKMLVIMGEEGEEVDKDTPIYDVAYCEPNKPEPKLELALPEGEIPTTAAINLEVSDPRCNHRADCWGKTILENYDCDSESVDFANGLTFSTAFIPNRPVQSLWELGAIHRGEPMRTINLKKYTAPKSSGGTYQDGDAALLAQVKIGSLKYSRGKFNANARNPRAWLELLRGINLENDYDDDTSDWDGDPPNPVFTEDISSSHSRAAIAEVLASFGSTDREQEALLGRTANLLTTRMDKYSVLAIGQALKRLSGVDEDNWAEIKKTVSNPLEYGGNYYSLLATQRILAHLVRDAWRNEYQIIQLQMLED